MDPNVKQNWIKALRSGDYEQGNQQLRSSIGEAEFAYCCLGVLCDIDDRIYWDNLNPTLAVMELTDGPAGEDTELHPDFRRLVNLTLDEQKELILMNDDQGRDFKQIADWIERNL